MSSRSLCIPSVGNFCLELFDGRLSASHFALMQRSNLLHFRHFQLCLQHRFKHYPSAEKLGRKTNICTNNHLNQGCIVNYSFFHEKCFKHVFPKYFLYFIVNYSFFHEKCFKHVFPKYFLYFIVNYSFFHEKCFKHVFPKCTFLYFIVIEKATVICRTLVHFLPNISLYKAHLQAPLHGFFQASFTRGIVI